MTPYRINAARLWSDLMTQGAIGALPGGGVDRMALTDGDRDARGVFAYWCAQAGLAMSVDGMGNMFARRDGADNSLPPVMLGSHLDTQSPGGKFDGILGVLAALEVARSLNGLEWRTVNPGRFVPRIRDRCAHCFRKHTRITVNDDAVVAKVGRGVGKCLGRFFRLGGVFLHG